MEWKQGLFVISTAAFFLGAVLFIHSSWAMPTPVPDRSQWLPEVEAIAEWKAVDQEEEDRDKGNWSQWMADYRKSVHRELGRLKGTRASGQ